MAEDKAKPAEPTLEEKREVIEQGNMHFDAVQLNISPLEDRSDSWFKNKINAARAESARHGSDKPDYHIQMFPEAHRLNGFVQTAEAAHDDTVSVIPAGEPNMRVVIKTAAAIKKDPSLDNEHKNKILALMEELPPPEGQVVAKNPQRAVLVYNQDRDGNPMLRRAFAGNLEGDLVEKFNGTAYHAHDIKGVNINVLTYYDAKVGNSGKVPGTDEPYPYGHPVKISLPVDIDSSLRPFKEEFIPTPEGAKEFLKETEGRKLTKNEPALDKGIQIAMENSAQLTSPRTPVAPPLTRGISPKLGS